MFSSQKNEMALGVTRRMDDRDSSRHWNLIPVPYQHVCLRRRHGGRLRRDDQSMEEAVEHPWGGKETTHCPTTGDKHRVSSVHKDAGRGQRLEIREATGVIRMAVGEEDVPDIGDISPQGVNSI